MRHRFKRTTLSVAAAQALVVWAAPAIAQTAAAPAADKKESQQLETVVVSGRRAALASAQKIKQESDEIVDSVNAEDIGKLPDRSVTEVLQRMVGVAMDRTQARSDPVHYSVEGSGVVIRGLTYVAAQLNGRETFSANQGRNLGFEDVPPELMGGVDVYKNPSAEQIEGAIAGLVNLRTALPFDYGGFKASGNLAMTYTQLNGKRSPQGSFLVSNTWQTDLGKFGALIDVAHSKSKLRTDTTTVDPYYPTTTTTNSVTTVNPDHRWYSRDLAWREQDYDRTRNGVYAALQWRKDNVESALTFFRSKFRSAMSEYAVKAEVDPYTINITDAEWGDNGLLRKGTLNSTTGGIEMENNARLSQRDSRTDDLSWNVRWRATPAWTLTADAQLVKSKTQSFDSNVATGIQLPKQTVDFTGSMPRIVYDAADIAFLDKPSNYYWATTMEALDHGKAQQKALRLDARYQFQDHPFLNDLRFGLRIADRDAQTYKAMPYYNWAAVTKAWETGWYIPDTARVTNYSVPTVVKSFNKFMGGKTTVPTMLFPDASVVQGFPNSYVQLHDLVKPLCDGMPGGSTCGWQGSNVNPYSWAPASYGDPSGVNDQHERTTAAFAQLRFAFDDLPMPVDGNVGLRVVNTKDRANGYTVIDQDAVPPGAGGVVVHPVKVDKVAGRFDQSFTDYLPSLNLRLKAQPDLQFRFALAKGLSRPSTGDMQATSKLKQSVQIEQNTGNVKSVSASGTSDGNPMLKPIKSTQADVTGEWYFSKTGAITVAAFDKELKDIIINQTYTTRLTAIDGTPVDFVVTGPTNGAKGHARGVEFAFRRYFDMLPGWLSGLGVEMNWTYVDSKLKRYNGVQTSFCSAGAGQDNLNLYVNGCDTDGSSFGGMPLPNLSRNTLNFTLMYDQGPLSARVAYSWRQRYLQGVALNSDNTGPNQQNALDTNPASATYGQHTLPLGLPLWGDSYGQLDVGMQYKFGSGLTVSLDALNLTNATSRQLMQQNIGTFVHNYFTSGRQYKLGMSYTF
ncbi:TonB-dependent receptor [Roseateles sp.]|uniref:TonB-dependent receptor n=1 Tax=Roseateles sp. TaxID=1971397 RepID=UPI002DF9EA17|nr:TonB-dependent receptor [Roseateles sp.]HEV6966310.1 TonB-dependent receptor [Roseateles sp.]